MDEIYFTGTLFDWIDSILERLVKLAFHFTVNFGHFTFNKKVYA